MKKKFILTGLITLLILVSFSITHTASATGQGVFGGRITSIQAVQVQALEDSNYGCNVGGTSITIQPVGSSPTSFVIPFSVRSKSGNTPRVGQWIIGLYSQSMVPITCIYRGYPPVESIVTLNPITLFGTSR